MDDVVVREGSSEEILDVRSKIPEFDLPYDANYLESRFKDKERLLLVAEKANINVGFIVAYDRDGDGSFYCWLAGVIPEYRKLGVFSLLMKYMDQWCKDKGYNKIKVKTHNNFRQMLMYLVRNEFNFTLVEPAEDILDYSIHLEKKL